MRGRRKQVGRSPGVLPQVGRTSRLLPQAGCMSIVPMFVG